MKQIRKKLPATFLEFFAGMGLVREALQPAGWTCLYANDLDAKKRQLYEARFAGDEYHLADVWDTDAVLKKISGSATLATASFPCTDLSLAGKGEGFAGKHSSAFFGFLRVLQALGAKRPPIVLLENVLGFLTARAGADFRVAVGALADLGYWLDAFVLDARWFVPQSRPRVFVLGLADRIIATKTARRATNQQDPLWEDLVRRCPQFRPERLVGLMRSTELTTGWQAQSVQSPACDRPPYDLTNVIDVDSGQDWWPQEKVDRHLAMLNAKTAADFARRIRSGNRFIGAGFRRIRSGACRLEVRFDGVAGCLRTPRGGSARQIVVLLERAGVQMRWMSPVECARLQGADSANLVGAVHQQLMGLGDAVCVPAVRWIADHLLRPLLSG